MIRDPVTGFEYPSEWAEACRSPELLGCVRKGLCVLTSSGDVLRRGYTTGTTAAAACKAAVLSLTEDVSCVEVKIPCDLTISIPVKANDGVASAIKYSGDYKADVTGNIEIIACARPAGEGILINAKAGVGRFTRDMPGYLAGSPAISKAAMECIRKAAAEALEVTGISGAAIEISIPKGEKIALRTLNSRMSIQGGISLLGSTGLVEPWDDHVGESVADRVGRADNVVITTGRAGLRYSRLLFPDHEAVLAGTRIGQALEHAKGDAIVCGLPALILKFIDPSILERTGYKTIAEMSMSDEFPSIINCTLASFKALNPHVRVVLVDRDGKVVGDSG
jgi:cobalt-precorrin-5B (C1)-methyltransferase